MKSRVSIFGLKYRDLRIFSGKIENFGNLTGVKDFTKSMSAHRPPTLPFFAAQAGEDLF